MKKERYQLKTRLNTIQAELFLADSLVTTLYYPDDNYQSGAFAVFVVQNCTKPLTVYSLIFQRRAIIPPLCGS